MFFDALTAPSAWLGVAAAAFLLGGLLGAWARGAPHVAPIALLLCFLGALVAPVLDVMGWLLGYALGGISGRLVRAQRRGR